MSGGIPGGHNAIFALNIVNNNHEHKDEHINLTYEYRLDKNFSNLKDDICKLKIKVIELMDVFIDGTTYYSLTEYKSLSYKIENLSEEWHKLQIEFNKLEKKYKNNTNINNTQLIETQTKFNEIKNKYNDLKKRINMQRRLLHDPLCPIL